MNDYVIKNGKKLRTGYTTGSCAAAAAKAGALMLLGGKEIEQVWLTLPSGEKLILEIEEIELRDEEVVCCVTKDGGDDPDVTHGLKIYTKVSKTLEGITIDGGVGVGRVTKEGLACRVGQAAINPVPRRMIEYSLMEAAEQYQYGGGFHAQVFVPGGEVTAKSTFNERLGILGGISILGTTGIVEPMSEAALIETIHLEMNARKGQEILFAAPGNYGLDFAKAQYELDMDQAVKCSNYIGELLDYSVYSGFQRLLLIGHIGKLVKLAAGVMNTHSKTADCRNEIFAAHAALHGADRELVQAVMEAGTTDEIHGILCKGHLEQAVYGSILKKIQFHINYRTRNALQTEFVVFSKENGLLMQTDGAMEYIQRVKLQSM